MVEHSRSETEQSIIFSVTYVVYIVLLKNGNNVKNVSLAEPNMEIHNKPFP